MSATKYYFVCIISFCVNACWLTCSDVLSSPSVLNCVAQLRVLCGRSPCEQPPLYMDVLRWCQRRLTHCYNPWKYPDHHISHFLSNYFILKLLKLKQSLFTDSSRRLCQTSTENVKWGVLLRTTLLYFGRRSFVGVLWCVTQWSTNYPFHITTCVEIKTN